MAVGRKRKPGKRYPCGRLMRGETEAEALSTALDARQRHFGISLGDARDPRLGSALGRLAICGQITDAQYRAGMDFAELYRAHHLALGLPLPTPRSAASLLTDQRISGSSANEASLETIERLKRRLDAATKALELCSVRHRSKSAARPALLVQRILCSQEDACQWSDTDVADLRMALDALARVFRR